MTNTSDSDPNFNRPFAPPNVILPSYNQNPRKKRTKISNNETRSSSTRPKPAKKPDPDAPNITQPCTECGRQFWSWKALHGHMRCHPERQWRGINPPPNHQRTVTTAPRFPVTYEEDHVVACSLLMLATGSTSGASRGVEGRFECEGCKKVFGSHQALGGHRETCNHVKGCLAITNLTQDPPPPPPPQQIVEQDHKRKHIKLISGINHRCNICFRVFSSGQALGGHMRCHWERDQKEKNKDYTVIDLNVPASTNMSCSSSDTLSECSLDLRLGL